MHSFLKRSAACRLLTTAILASIAMPLGGCNSFDSRGVVELKSALAAPPQALAAECERPVDLADGALSAGATERLWAQDRAGLAACHDRHGSLIDFYVNRDRGLAGK